ncbi:MAG: adenylosuccinate synthetase [Patescibacteria group bacterium]
MAARPNSFAFCGGAFGDEGKGRIVDEYVADLATKKQVVVFRDNGGANAGHTVVLPDGTKIALHQVPSGVFCEKAHAILGKEMVLHPGDLLLELSEIEHAAKKHPIGTITIDEQTILSLDTHRAFEAALKNWQTGSKGSTGRGISPAYADVLLRHPLRLIDCIQNNKQKITEHYTLYQALLAGLDQELSTATAPTLNGTQQTIGSLKEFTDRLLTQTKTLKKYCSDTMPFVRSAWADTQYAWVFEKAQAIGLDRRWGVYPDITASNACLDGIDSATEGIINSNEIMLRAGVIKATYMSSVGSRKLPTQMPTKLADRIRQDAGEYGATTKRPRDIAYLDLVALRFYSQVGNLNALVLTHMDISYPEVSLQVCTDYTKDGAAAPYRPDQTHLDTVSPVYQKLQFWNPKDIQDARTPSSIPKAAQALIDMIEDTIGIPVWMITTGSQRDQSLKLTVQKF